jgi:hypothetical protein
MKEYPQQSIRREYEFPTKDDSASWNLETWARLHAYAYLKHRIYMYMHMHITLQLPSCTSYGLGAWYAKFSLLSNGYQGLFPWG